MPSLQGQISILSLFNDEKYGVSLARRLFNDCNELSHGYWRTYSDANTQDSDIYQVAIFGIEWFNSYYSQHLKIDPHYPNIYIMRKNLVDFIAFEISADETSIFHAIINIDKQAFSVQINVLTEDRQLQRDVDTVYKSLEKRLDNMNQPFYVADNTEGIINLPLPNDNTHLYCEQLKLITSQGVEIELPTWGPDKHGDIARRIRKLGMYKDDYGPFLGVNGDLRIDYPKWEVLNTLERAEHEERVLGRISIKIPHLHVHMIALHRDKYQGDGAGSVFLLAYNDNNYQVNVNDSGQFESSIPFEHDFDTDGYDIFKTDDINVICETWWDGMHLAPVWEHLLSIVDIRSNDVSTSLVKEMVLNWLHLVE